MHTTPHAFSVFSLFLCSLVSCSLCCPFHSSLSLFLSVFLPVSLSLSHSFLFLALSLPLSLSLSLSLFLCPSLSLSLCFSPVFPFISNSWCPIQSVARCRSVFIPILTAAHPLVFSRNDSLLSEHFSPPGFPLTILHSFSPCSPHCVHCRSSSLFKLTDLFLDESPLLCNLLFRFGCNALVVVW
jgi:hypothetical protein